MGLTDGLMVLLWGSCSCRKVRATAQSVSATLVGPGPRLAVADGSEDEGSAAGDQKLHGRLVEEAAMWRQIELQQRFPNGPGTPKGNWSPEVLEGAYVRCGEVTADYAKTFYLGTQLMTPEQARAVWAIYVWCRRTDELVDGPNASRITPEALDRWEERLESLFEGRPYDILDAALTDTVAKFPLDIQPFRDMIEGMRMDMRKSRYETFDELYEYCYRVAGTVALMTCPVMGMEPSYKGPLEPVYRTALALGTANQLTNILRDVGEDIRERNRIYLPLEELARFGIQEEELLSGLHAPSTGRMDDRWQAFMSWQIERAHSYFRDAEAGVTALSPQARWPVFSALDLYRRILNAIEDNGYDNFTQRAYVPRHVKMMQLPFAFLKGMNPPMFAPEAVARFQSLSPRAKSAQLLAVQESDAGLAQKSARSQ